MGVDTRSILLVVSSAFGCMSMVAYCVALSQPFHTISFFTMEIIRVTRLCNGLSYAYYAGFAVIFALAINLFLQLLATFLLYRAVGKGSRKYWHVASLIQTVCIILVLCALGAYYFTAGMSFDTLSQTGLASLVMVALDASKECGVGLGFMIGCVAAALQVVQLVCGLLLNVSDRESDADPELNNKEVLRTMAPLRRNIRSRLI